MKCGFITRCNSQCGVTIGGLVRGPQPPRPVVPAIGHQGAGVLSPPAAHPSASSGAVWNIKLANNRQQRTTAERWLLLMYLDGTESRLKIYYNYVPIIYFAFNGDWDERNYVRRLESFWTINPGWDEIWVTRSVTTFNKQDFILWLKFWSYWGLV